MNPISFAAFAFALWSRLLHDYTDEAGRVDYARLRANPADRVELDELYAQVGAESAPDEAFYIDAYNVVVWKNVIDNEPKRVDESLYKFFRRDYLVAGKTMTLDALEKKVIRPLFRDPRVHVALNCASAGCPLLPREAFTPDRLNAQLEREAARFCNERRNVDWDARTNTVKLSRIFDWYDKDFGDRIQWINRYRKDKIPAKAKVEFVEWDWRLNDRSLAR